MPRKKKEKENEEANNQESEDSLTKGSKPKKPKDDKTNGKKDDKESGGSESNQEIPSVTQEDESIVTPEVVVESIEIPCTVIYKGKIYLKTEDASLEALEAMEAKLKRLAEGKCKKWH